MRGELSQLVFCARQHSRRCRRHGQPQHHRYLVEFQRPCDVSSWRRGSGGCGPIIFQVLNNRAGSSSRRPMESFRGRVLWHFTALLCIPEMCASLWEFLNGFDESAVARLCLITDKRSGLPIRKHLFINNAEKSYFFSWGHMCNLWQRLCQPVVEEIFRTLRYLGKSAKIYYGMNFSNKSPSKFYPSKRTKKINSIFLNYLYVKSRW